jgi:hypothetical protein
MSDFNVLTIVFIITCLLLMMHDVGGAKYELEALYSLGIGRLADMVIEGILNEQYI